ncbi:hypothetical protein FOMG_14402 [Fusarium oxysporum f. sp. melonis 26406]|uniref:Uncharacterized protein n=1 Tax=Fusarium oxysporum f. sp. melonis 26406 TaxID=1089452 RepID=W9ZBP6_FUSOX|nr:hypothetical protein FOMG_14402 [Fusarium oxysporum f. sp. melonis 26406]
MRSFQILTGVLAFIVANNVSAGPCRPSFSSIGIKAVVDTTMAKT